LIEDNDFDINLIYPKMTVPKMDQEIIAINTTGWTNPEKRLIISPDKPLLIKPDE
jgi:hypothetical protein